MNKRMDLPKLPGVNYSFRPRSYEYDPLDVVRFLTKDIQNQYIRELVRDWLREGSPENHFIQAILMDEINEVGESAQLVERLNPEYMGGNHSAPFLPFETEIGRICLASTTGDVISIRARSSDAGYHYRIVDEYYLDDGEYDIGLSYSKRPLTFRQFILLIESATIRGMSGTLPFGWEYTNIDCGDDDLDTQDYREFTHVESDFYPHTTEHFEQHQDLVYGPVWDDDE
ncbi:MAG: hypothetical protein LPK79_09965 [Bacteroidota bacterium]|nr:hypothetical protein [Bacteroidota bacterium]